MDVYSYIDPIKGVTVTPSLRSRAKGWSDISSGGERSETRYTDLEGPKRAFVFH